MLGGVRLLALADALEQCGQVIGGEFPVERPGGAVVAVHEGQQGMAEGAQAGKSFGVRTFFWMTEKKIISSIPPDLVVTCGSVSWTCPHGAIWSLARNKKRQRQGDLRR